MHEVINFVKNFYAEYNTIINVLMSIIIFLFFFFIRNKLSKLILNFTGRVCFNKENKEEKRESLIQSLIKPLSLFFTVTGLYLALIINFSNVHITKIYKISVILILCWALVNYLSNNLFLLFHFDKSNSINETAIRFISNILKVIVIAFAVLMILSEFGYNVNGFITGLGVGGLAISLAAQDAISNLISGFIIIFEKPFEVGDFIQTSTIQGTVEEVAMRSTKIRTIEDSVVTVPNSTLSKDSIVNISKINKRLINFDIGLVYSTSNSEIEACISDIKNYLINQDYIVDFPIRVNFVKLDDSSLNINIYCYTTITEINAFNEILGVVNTNIKEIIENNKCEFAFPSNSIYIEKK